MPERIQLRRTKGWRKPAGAVVVARPTRWGNAWSVGAEATITALSGPARVWPDWPITITPEIAVELYRQQWQRRLTRPSDGLPGDLAFWRRDVEAIESLRGRDLACWCPLEDDEGNRVSCHADVLLELANRDALPDLPCPSKRCTGHLGPPDATGTHHNGTTVEWRTCTRCGRIVERPADLDHPTLDLDGLTP